MKNIKKNKFLLILIFFFLIITFIFINNFLKKYIKNEYFKNDIKKQNSYYKIVNVYQEKYKNNILGYGLGDFIRGSYFVIQYSKLNNKLYDIYFNHPISNFLKNKFIHDKKIPYENIEFNISLTNFKEFIVDNYIKREFFNDKKMLNKIKDFFNSQIIVNGTLYVSSNTYPFREISIDERNFMRYKLEPNDDMVNFIKDNLKKIGLENNKYIIIHIRTGDKYLFDKNKKINNSFKEKIIQNIYNLITIEKNIEFLLISDNINLKKEIANTYNNIKFIDNEITHSGEGQKLDQNKIKNTLLDFYLMSYSSKIYSFTVHTHGSGFAQWCAITYNIPYSLKYIRE